MRHSHKPVSLDDVTGILANQRRHGRGQRYQPRVKATIMCGAAVTRVTVRTDRFITPRPAHILPLYPRRAV